MNATSNFAILSLSGSYTWTLHRTNLHDSLSWSTAGGVVKLTTHLHIVPRSRMSGAIPQLPHLNSWRAKGQLCLLPSSMLLNVSQMAVHLECRLYSSW